jgi:nitrate/nitrite transport system substrate-binding protein
VTAEELPQTDGFKKPTAEFIDDIEYDGKDPVGYLRKFKVGVKEAL